MIPLKCKFKNTVTISTYLLSQRVAFAQAACGERSHACTECTTAYQHTLVHSLQVHACSASKAQAKLSDLGKGWALPASNKTLCILQRALLHASS